MLNSPVLTQMVMDPVQLWGLCKPGVKTFDTYKLPGHGDLWNGFDDLLAGLNYAKHRYGPGLSALGNGHGYEYGGEVRKHGFYEIAEKGLPETIIPMDINKRPRALSLINETLDKMESDGGGTQAVAQRYENRNSNTEKLLTQAVSLLAQVVGVGKQQVDASWQMAKTTTPCGRGETVNGSTPTTVWTSV